MLNIQLTPVVKKLLIINVAVFLIQNTIGKHYEYLFKLHDFKNYYFYPFQYLSHMFMHANFRHLLSNSLPLLFFASYLESLLGPKRFLAFYLICGLGAGVFYSIIHHYELIQFVDAKSLEYSPSESWAYLNSDPNRAMLGASGAVFGVLMGCAIFFPDMEIMIIPIPVPIKMKYMVLVYGVYELITGVYKVPGDNVAHFAHLGGMLFAYLIVKYWRKYN